VISDKLTSHPAVDLTGGAVDEPEPLEEPDGEHAQGGPHVGEAAKAAGRARDGYTIREHPDLDALNLELNNLYGNSFD